MGPLLGALVGGGIGYLVAKEKGALIGGGIGGGVGLLFYSMSRGRPEGTELWDRPQALDAVRTQITSHPSVTSTVTPTGGGVSVPTVRPVVPVVMDTTPRERLTLKAVIGWHSLSAAEKHRVRAGWPVLPMGARDCPGGNWQSCDAQWDQEDALRWYCGLAANRSACLAAGVQPTQVMRGV